MWMVGRVDCAFNKTQLQVPIDFCTAVFNDNEVGVD